ncbi:MAG TPA: response regulator [Anaerolineales bacterium]|nr:response regulator [Anaerolineales bacterium]
MSENNTFAKDVRISVVDDDASMREAIKALIGSTGLTVEDFSSAEEFLSSGRAQLFDCLILDVMMPGLSGLDLQQRLRTENQRLPIIFVTAHYNEKDRTRALAAGAVAFLAKPFTEQELFLAMSASLARAKGTDDEASDF